MKIGLLGCGVVGKEVLKMIDAMPSEKVEVVRILTRNKRHEPRFTTDFNDLMNDDIDTIIEVMGGVHPAYEYIKASLNAKKNVISANKAVIAKHFKEFADLAMENEVSFKIEASVGGGIPWIRELQRVKRMDTIQQFSGIFNGTTNYILDRMHQYELSFETALMDAQKKGYAESDPSSDIDGFDIQNKCAISASVAYDTFIDVNKIPVFGIASILKEDIDYFKSKNLVCKLMGFSKHYGSSISLYVCPICVNGLMAHVGDNLNIASCTSQHLGKLEMIGQGAGGSPTATAVISDLLDLFENNTTPFLFHHFLDIDNSKELHHFYLRERIEDFHEELALSYEKDETYIYMKTKRMTLTELLSIVSSKDVFLALLEDKHENR